jgi:hypothetical protein
MRTGEFWITKPCIMAKDNFVKIQNPGQIRQTQQTDVARNTKKIYRASLHQTRPKERPQVRRKDEGENDIRTVGIVN